MKGSDQVALVLVVIVTGTISIQLMLAFILWMNKKILAHLEEKEASSIGARKPEARKV